MKRNFKNLMVIAAFLLMNAQLSGCGKMKEKMNLDGNSKTNEVNSDVSVYSAPPPSPQEYTIKDEMKKSSSPGGNTGMTNNDADIGFNTSDKIDDSKEIIEKVPSKIIKTADIKIQVKNYNDSRKKILSLVNQIGAYVQSENQTNYNASIDNIMVIRVKSEEFDNLVEKLLEESIYVDSKKIVADDITEEFVDVQARLKSKKETELQYIELLKKAKTINEILYVQQYIKPIREEIESFEGRLKYMNDKASYSTINLTFYEKIPYTMAPSVENGFLYRIGKAFSGGWNVLLSFFIGIVALWPLWLIVGAVLFTILHLVKRKKK